MKPEVTLEQYRLSDDIDNVIVGIRNALEQTEPDVELLKRLRARAVELKTRLEKEIEAFADDFNLATRP